MTAGVGEDVWLACGYGPFLLLVAFGLDRLARKAAVRSLAWRSGGFSYHADHDAWVCPEDQWLWPQSFDPDNRVMRYRASPAVCNSCPVKETCTSSEHGREITRNVDPWPASEAERFHRGIACAIVVLGVAWPVLTLLGNRTLLERTLLVVAALVVALGSWPLWSHLRRTPARFPFEVAHVKVEALDEAVRVREETAAKAARRRTTYSSDRRTLPAAGGGQSFAEQWSAADGGAAASDSGWSRIRKR